jgi:hypothetical protein
MALKLRRGTDLQRQTITPQEGELLYTTDTKKLYVGDGSIAGGVQVAPIYSNDLIERTSLFYTTERAQDDAASMFTTTTTVSTTHSGITFAYNDAAGKIVATVPDKGTVTSALGGQIATYNATGTTISGTTGLDWDNDLRQLSLSNSSINVTASTGNRSVIIMETNAPGSIGNNISFARSRGTSVTPTAVQTLDTMGGIVFNGYDGSNYLTGASLYAYNPSGFSIGTGVMPTAVNLNLTDGSGINATRFRVFPDGKTIVGPWASTESGTGQLLVNVTTNPDTGFANSAVQIRSYHDQSFAQRQVAARARGTLANPTALQNGDEIFGYQFHAWDGSIFKVASAIRSKVDGTITSGKVPGSIIFGTGSGSTGTLTFWLTLDSAGLLTHTGNFKRTGTQIISPNYATITTSSTVNLSTTTSNNLLLVGNSGLTVTLNMPTTPADGQICEFIVHSNNTTLAVGTGTVVPTFAGAVTYGTAFKYVYRTSNTTWYKLG